MVVIVGAGIAGCATAYFLSTTNTGPITIIDQVGPAAGSSGRAGAFLTNCPPLGQKSKTDKRQALFDASFRLHQKLAKDLNLESYCQVQNYQYIQTAIKSSDKDDHSYKSLSDSYGETLKGEAALVDPAELTNALLEKSLARGCIFKQASVTGLETDASKRCITAILLEDKKLSIQEDEPVVIALGPWSCMIEDWLGYPMPIEGVVSTSLIYKDSIPVSDLGTALFFDEDSNGCSLEIFGRQDRSLYVSGCGESEVIGTEVLRSSDRPTPDYCPPSMARAAAAQSSLKNMGWVAGDPDVFQACIRPMSPDGSPIVGKVFDNGYVATGGGPWGITWGPIMGQCLASIINQDDDAPIRLGQLRPDRFDNLVYQTLLKSRTQK